MRYTLLEITQDILSSMDSDEVNSISDTVESDQVVTIIKTAYDDIVSRSGLAAQKILFNLTASGNNAKPVLMTRPSNVINVDWVQYNTIQVGDTDPNWVDIRYLPIHDFMFMSNQLLPSATDVDSFSHTVNGFTFTFNYRNNRGPCYFTTFDDNSLVFDAFDSAVDTTLQSSKTLCSGTRDFTFTKDDNWTPELPPDKFALLLSEAKSLAWSELKQTPHQKAEQAARRNWTHLSKGRKQVPAPHLDNNAHPFNKLPFFGRR